MVFLLDDITLILILPKILVMLVVDDQHDDQRVNKVWHLKKRIFFQKYLSLHGRLGDVAL